MKGLQQNGEVEPCGSALAEQIVLMRGQQPMPGQFVRVPLLLHVYKDGRLGRFDALGAVLVLRRRVGTDAAGVAT